MPDKACPGGTSGHDEKDALVEHSWFALQSRQIFFYNRIKTCYIIKWN